MGVALPLEFSEICSTKKVREINSKTFQKAGVVFAEKKHFVQR